MSRGALKEKKSATAGIQTIYCQFPTECCLNGKFYFWGEKELHYWWKHQNGCNLMLGNSFTEKMRIVRGSISHLPKLTFWIYLQDFLKVRNMYFEIDRLLKYFCVTLKNFDILDLNWKDSDDITLSCKLAGNSKVL